MTANLTNADAVQRAAASAESRKWALFCVEVDEETLREACDDCDDGTCVRCERTG